MRRMLPDREPCPSHAAYPASTSPPLASSAEEPHETKAPPLASALLPAGKDADIGMEACEGSPVTTETELGDSDGIISSDSDDASLGESTQCKPSETRARGLSKADSQAMLKAYSPPVSPLTMETEPGDSSPSSVMSDSDSMSPATTTKPESSSDESSSPEDSLRGLIPRIDGDTSASEVQALLARSIDRARKLLKRRGVDTELAGVLERYVDAAAAMLIGAVDMDEVLMALEELHAKVQALAQTAQAPRPVIDCSSPSHTTLFDAVLGDGQEDQEATAASSRTDVESKVRLFRSAPSVDSKDLVGSPEVLLHVYEVGFLSKGAHQVLTTFGGGAFHLGVEVYGREWSYGQSRAKFSNTGVLMQRTPRVHAGHRYVDTVALGCTSLSPVDVQTLIIELESKWLADDYHVLRQNCVAFAEEFSIRLGVQPLPDHVSSMSQGLKKIFYA